MRFAPSPLFTPFQATAPEFVGWFAIRVPADMCGSRIVNFPTLESAKEFAILAKQVYSEPDGIEED